MSDRFNIKDVSDFWDSVASNYDGINQKIGSTHYQRFTESIKHLKIKKNDKVLNIWSRTGNAIPYLEKKADIKLFNLEVSKAMIKIAKLKYPGRYFEPTDLTHLNFENNFFDSILSLETLEHCPNPQKFINELFRVLKPGKHLVMSLPPKTAEIPLTIFELFFHNHGEGPHQFLPSKEVKKILSKAGFRLILHKGTLLLPIGPEFLRKIGEMLIDKFQNTPLKELGIRQFYVCQKPNC